MSFRYNSYKKNKKDNKDSLIKLYEDIEARLLSGSKDYQSNPKICYNLYIIESDYIVKLKKFLENNRNNKIKDFNEKIKIINNFDEIINIICNGKQIGFVDENFINTYIKYVKKGFIKSENFGSPYEIYFGYKKNLIYINNDSILLIIYKQNYLNEYRKKYYICQLHNRQKKIIKKNLIKNILDINPDNLIRYSKYIEKNIELIELNTNKEKRIVNQNIILNQNSVINATFSNNLGNRINNNISIHNNINQFNNNETEESIKESIPYNNKEVIKTNQVIPQINHNHNQNQNNIPENITPNKTKEKEAIETIKTNVINEPKIPKINSQPKKIEEEKSINYNEEKLKKLYEKQIGESLLSNLENTNEIQLHKNIQKLKQLENEISILSRDLYKINREINELNEQNNNYNEYINNPNELDDDDNLTLEQIEKRKEIDKILNGNKIEENNKKIGELNYVKNIKENALNKKIQEKNETFYIIENLKYNIQQGNNIKYNKAMLKKSIVETEKLNKINKDKEELNQLKNKIIIREQLKAEEIIKRKQEEMLKEQQKKLEEEKEQERNKLIQEEYRKKLEEEERKEKLKEREEQIQKEKNEQYRKEQAILEERLNNRIKNIKEQKEEIRKGFELELQKNKNELDKLKEKKLKEQNEKDIIEKKKEKNEIEWNKKIEESNKREKLNGIKNMNKLSEIIEEEINEEDKEKNESQNKINEEEELIKKREEEELIKKREEEELIKKRKEEEKEKLRIEEEMKTKLEKEILEKKQKEEELKKKQEEEKLRQEDIKRQIEKEKEEMIIKKQQEEEKLRQEEMRKRKELEEKKKQEQIKKMKELEEKKKQEQIKKQKELEEKKKLEELEKIQKEKEQKEFEEQQKKKQKEFEEQQKKNQKELEQIKLKQKAEEELLNQQKQNQNQNNIQSTPPKKIISCKLINPPPLIGLQNIGSTCYMNATLQCFSHTEILTDYFLNENNRNKIYNNNITKKNPTLLQLSPSYLNLITNLWLSNQKYFSPFEFRKRIADMNPLFKELSANDAKDLLNFLLMQLHEELNLYEEKNILEENEPNFNPYNEQMALENFVKNFFGKNKSVLSDHFFGLQESKFLCMGCEKKNFGFNLPIKYSFQTFNFLFLPLEEVRKFKYNNNLMNNMQMINNMNQNQFNMMNNMNNMNNNMIINNIIIQNNINNPNSVNIYDCFEYLQKDEIFSGDNAMWCNMCNGLLPCKNKTVIYTGPNILILILSSSLINM